MSRLQDIIAGAQGTTESERTFAITERAAREAIRDLRRLDGKSPAEILVLTEKYKGLNHPGVQVAIAKAEARATQQITKNAATGATTVRVQLQKRGMSVPNDIIQSAVTEKMQAAKGMDFGKLTGPGIRTIVEDLAPKPPVKPPLAPKFLGKGSLSRKAAIPAAIIAGLLALRGAGGDSKQDGQLPPHLQAQLQLAAIQAQGAGQKTNKDLVNAMRVISMLKNLQGMTQAATAAPPVGLI